ncbi:hypothetical protein H4S01_000145 [Coemansia sp. RSA 2610]|nr:hypothetical protein H4S01_000145 [Coemansia sp. RSA 2610]
MTLAKSKQPPAARPVRNARRQDDAAKTASTESDNTEDAETNGTTAPAPKRDHGRAAGQARPGKAPAAQAKRAGAASGSMRPIAPAAPPAHAAAPVGAFVLPPPPLTDSNLSLTQIIEEYGERTDLLKLVLAAKTEQDRARAEYERRVQEELRFETRRLEFEMMLHSNHFKQQEQLIPVHRNDVVLQSPIGALAHPQPVPAAHVVAPYGVPVAHDPHTRSYHHPDTPGGLDGRGAQNPFAFFKMPLGQQVHHPSAYAAHGDKQGPHVAVPGHPTSTPPRAGSGANAVIGNRRPVPPAVSGLTVRTAGDGSAANAPHSAPVDGPENKKRKVSHDDVIMALRRKVMSKGTQWQQSAPPPPQRLAPTRRHHAAHQKHQSEDASRLRRSSLAVITSAEDADSLAPSDSPSTSSSSGSSRSVSSSSSTTPLSTANAAAAEPAAMGVEAGKDDESSKMRVSSISSIVDQEPVAADERASY